MTPRLKELYFKKIQPSLKEKFAFKNAYMSPQLQKVVINMGLGLDGNDSKILKSCSEDLAEITGQKPVITKFRKSISNFKKTLPKTKYLRRQDAPNVYDLNASIYIYNRNIYVKYCIFFF